MLQSAPKILSPSIVPSSRPTSCPHCQRLRDRIEQLEEVIGDIQPVRIRGLRPAAQRMLSMISARGYMSRESLYAVLYGDLAEDEQPEFKILDVTLAMARKFCGPYGIKVETVWGKGWKMSDESRRKYRALAAQYGAKA